MAKKSLEEREKQIKKLEQEIKAEKLKINETLGKSIIKALNLSYGSVTDAKIQEICSVLSEHYANK